MVNGQVCEKSYFFITNHWMVLNGFIDLFLSVVHVDLDAVPGFQGCVADVFVHSSFLHNNTSIRIMKTACPV